MSDDPTPQTDDQADERAEAAKAAWGAPHAGTPAPSEPAAADAAPPASIYTTLSGEPIAPGAPFGEAAKRGPSPFGTVPKRDQSPFGTASKRTQTPLWSGQVTPPSPLPATDSTSDRPHYVLASWGARLGAMLIDNILFGFVALFAAVAAGVALGLTVDESFAYFGNMEPLPENIRDEAPFAAVLAGQVMLQLGLIVWFLYKGNGQTPGKRATRVRVVRADGHAFTLGLAFKREVLVKTLPIVLLGGIAVAFAPGLSLLVLMLFAANYLWPLWDPQRRALHDMVAGTRVVKVDRP